MNDDYVVFDLVEVGTANETTLLDTTNRPCLLEEAVFMMPAWTKTS
jgi:hypothetical protein